MPNYPIVLASQSPRRRELMALVVPAFEIEVAAVDESAFSWEENPAQVAAQLAGVKAQAVFARRPQAIVIGCDTVVELDGQVLGKPKTKDEAVAMLTALAARRHKVHTGVAVYAPQQAPFTFFETTTVEFSAVAPEDILACADTDEPYDKAGAYGIQGWAARFVTRIEGCYYNVMGLPVAALYRSLKQHKLI